MRKPPAVLLVLALAALGSTVACAPEPSTDPAGRARQIVAELGDEDLVGQVLVPYAYGTSATEVSPAAAEGNRRIAGVATPAEMIAKYRLGGLILVSRAATDPTAGTNPTTNIDSPAQVRALTDGLQEAARTLPASVPLLIGTDQEYGTVTRITRGVTQLPSAMTFGAAGDPALTEAAWQAAGTELAALGINVDFAPVADVLGGQGSQVIGSRSYGSDPARVAEQVAAAVRGLRSAGVFATLKHFPGHGRTTGDSHTELPALTQDRAALGGVDLPPFTAGIQAGAELVMSGHLDVRAVDAGVPATFSSKVLIDLLRGQLGFGGVVVSDALNMAPARQWAPGEAAVRALMAGNDLLLMPPDLPAARTGLLDGLRSGVLPRSRLVEAATRIITLKLRLAGAERPALSTVSDRAHADAPRAVAARAVTVLRGTCSALLPPGPVTVTASAGRDQQRRWLSAALTAVGVEVADSGGTMVHLVGYGDGAADLNPAAAVTVAMDTPDVLALAGSEALLATYSSSQPSLTALAAVLAGKAAAPGRSPVPVRGLPPSVCPAAGAG